MPHSIQAILFDLDGTLLDTAPEFTFCINQLLQEHGRAHHPVEYIRPAVSFGSAGIVQRGFALTETDPLLGVLNQRLPALYKQHLGSHTLYFPGIEPMLAHLALCAIPWGIVTNKPTTYVAPLVQQFSALKAAQCVIAGDTFGVSKPDPLPLQKACQMLKIAPQHCLYVGDAKTDVQASHAAGMPCAVAHYGYIPSHEDAHNWNGDIAVHHPSEIISLLRG